MNEKSAAPERIHHPFSPSKLQYLEACINYTGEQSESEAAQRGTYKHFAVDDKGVDDPKLDDSDAGAVAKCLEFRNRIRKDFRERHDAVIFLEISEEYLPIDDAEFVWEDRLWKGTTAGYLDWAIISPCRTVAHIADWKFGQWSVTEAADNLQGMAYALGLRHKFPTLEKIWVSFVMPEKNTVSQTCFTKADLDAAYTRIVRIVSQARAAQQNGDFSQARVMAPSCLFCANRGKCPVLLQFAHKLSKKFMPLYAPEAVTPSFLVDPKRATELMTLAQLMEGWAKGIRQQMTRRTIEDDAFLPEGYNLRQRQDYTITSREKLEAAAKDAGLTETQIDAARRMTIGEILDGISENTPRGQKNEAKKAFKERLIEAGILLPDPVITFLERVKT